MKNTGQIFELINTTVEGWMATFTSIWCFMPPNYDTVNSMLVELISARCHECAYKYFGSLYLRFCSRESV